MPSPLKIRLAPSEEQELLKLISNPKIPQRTRKRVEALRLSSKGWEVAAIANYLNCASNTVRQTFYRWLTRGIEGLFDAPRPGRTPVWTEEDIKHLENCLEKDSRTYNSRQLVEKLFQERSITLSRDRLRKILKKKLEMEKNESQ